MRASLGITLGLLLSLMLVNASAETVDSPLKPVSAQFSSLDPALMFFYAHPKAEFAKHKLWIVSSTQTLPAPKWVVAESQKGNTFLLLPEVPESWNTLVANEKLNLEGKKALGRFPALFLKIIAPDEKAKWKFNKSELASVSKENRELLKGSWKVRKQGKGYWVRFFSQAKDRHFLKWEISLTTDGQIKRLKTEAID